MGERLIGRTAITALFSADSHWLDLTMAQKRRTRRGHYVLTKALCGLRATWSTSTFVAATCAKCRSAAAAEGNQGRELTR